MILSAGALLPAKPAVGRPRVTVAPAPHLTRRSQGTPCCGIAFDGNNRGTSRRGSMVTVPGSDGAAERRTTSKARLALSVVAPAPNEACGIQKAAASLRHREGHNEVPRWGRHV